MTSTRPRAIPSPPDAAPDAETVVERPPAAASTVPCRRLEPRLPVRPGARAEARKLGLLPGPDVAVGLLDVSPRGVRLRLRGAAGWGDLFSITLREPGGRACARAMAAVRWSMADRDGTVVAGLAFGRSLPPDVVGRLAAPTVGDSVSRRTDPLPDVVCRPASPTGQRRGDPPSL